MASANQFLERRLASSGGRILSHDSGALLFIALCWIAAVILVNPIGEFPSDDDWSYVSAVRALVERGEISFSDWTSPNLISQVLWGALFALPFGASYTTLRISTLVAALLGAFAFFRLIRNTDRPTSFALFSALLLLFNPIFCALSFTFMTDVPFVAAQTGAMLFLMAGLRSGSRLASALGWLLALAAQLCRQTGLAIPFAYGGGYLVKQGWGIKRVVMSVLPLVAFIGVQWTYQYWLQATGKTPLLFGRQAGPADLFGSQAGPAGPALTPSALVARLYHIVCFIFFYLGLILFPITLPAVAAMINALPRKVAVAVSTSLMVLAAVIVRIAFQRGMIMPIGYNIWNQNGIGPDLAGGVPVPRLFWQVVTLLSVSGGVLLLASLAFAAFRTWSVATRDQEAWGLVFGLLGAAATAGFLFLVALQYDRYLLPLIPWLALSVAFAVPRVQSATLPRWCLAAGGVLLAGMAFYSIVTAHNYLAEKRVVVVAIDGLTARGVPRDSIDGSWVFNGDALYGRTGNSNFDWYRSRDYIVGFQMEPNYTLLRRYPVPRWPIWHSRGPDLLVHGPKTGPE